MKVNKPGNSEKEEEELVGEKVVNSERCRKLQRSIIQNDNQYILKFLAALQAMLCSLSRFKKFTCALALYKIIF